MESIIRDRIQEHMTTNNLFSPNQHGFSSRKSCITQLLTAVNSWTKSLKENNSIDVIYFDFAKAFSLVPHKHLVVKLESYGILVEKLFVWQKTESCF